MKKQFSKIISANDFYDEVADIYEQMIDFKKKSCSAQECIQKNIFLLKEKKLYLNIRKIILNKNQNNYCFLSITEKKTR